MSVQKAKGILIPIGGNEDKGLEKNEMYTLEFIEQGILFHVVKEAGGIDAKIVIVPSASSIPHEVSDNYKRAFAKLQCTNVHVLNIRSRKDAEKKESIEMMKSADCVLFSGGNQSKITKYMRDTEIHKILIGKYQNEHFVIAGTSAGAMCMSRNMITGGSGTESFRKGTVRMARGMAFIPELIIDSHFIQRARFGRLCEAVARYPEMIGVGLAEDTGLIIRNNREFEVIGSGMVIVFDGRSAKNNNQSILEPGTPMTLTDLKTHILSNGDKFELQTRKITVLPLQADFV